MTVNNLVMDSNFKSSHSSFLDLVFSALSLEIDDDDLIDLDFCSSIKISSTLMFLLMGSSKIGRKDWNVTRQSF